MSTFVRTVTMIEFVASLVACVVFVVLYHMRSRGRWAVTAMGRNVMILMTALGLITVLSLARSVFGDYPGHEFVLMVLFGVYTFVLWGRVRLLQVIFRDAHPRGGAGEKGDRDVARS